MCEVIFELYHAFQSSTINIVPGQKLCPMCRNKLPVREQSKIDSRNSDVSDEINYIEEIQSTTYQNVSNILVYRHW